MDNSVEEFINTLQKNPGKSGKLIQEMIDESNRFLLNFPFIGIARKISSQLRDKPFSDFYTFERTLAHKLHPTLFKNNLNILSNNIIEKIFKEKYSIYESVFPQKVINNRGNSSQDNIHKLNSLKDLILRLEAQEGSFMVIKFCDYILSRIAPELGNMIKSIEFTINLTRKQFTEDKEFNFKIFKNRFDDFNKKFGDDFSELFIIRTSWDFKLKEYADMLLSKDDLKKSKGRSEKSRKLIKKYADKVKEDYLNKTEDDNAERIKKIVDNVYSNNSKKFGKTSGDEIMEEILSSWLEDSNVSNQKKKILKNILDDLFPLSSLETETASSVDINISDDMEWGEENNEDAVTSKSDKFEDDFSEAGNDELLNEFKIDDNELNEEEDLFEIKDEKIEELKNFDVIDEGESENIEKGNDIVEEETDGKKSLDEKHEEEPDSFNIADKQDLDEIEKFDITDKQDVGELEKFDIIDKQDSDELEKFDITDKKDADELKNFDILDKENSERSLNNNDITISENTDSVHGSKQEISIETDSLKKFIITDDLSSDNKFNELSSKIKKMISKNPEKSVEELEIVMNRLSLDPVVWEAILEQYKESDNPILEKLYMSHRMVDSTEGLPEKIGKIEEIKKTLVENGTSSVLINSLDGRIEKVKDEEKKIEAVSSLISSLKGLDGDKQELFIMKKTDDVTLPDEIRKSVSRISDALKSDQFDNVLFSITSAGDPPEMKVGFLDSLKTISTKRGWINDDPYDDLSQERSKKIEDKRAFYNRLTENRNDEKSIFREKESEYREVFSGKGKKRKFSEIKNEIKSKKKKKKKKDDTPDIEGMSQEEKVYHYSNNIIKAFSDNIEALEPVIGILTDANIDSFKNNLVKQFNIFKKEKEILVLKTDEMVKSGNPDLELISNIQKIQPKLQFLWRKELLKMYSKNKLEDIFSVFSKNKEIYDSLIRISRIINNNNANNFLQQSVEREVKLIQIIKDNLTEEKLKKLKIKTKNRKDKEKINIFRDLIHLTGSLEGSDDTIKNIGKKDTSALKDTRDDEKKIKKEFDSMVKDDDISPAEEKSLQIQYIKDVSREVDAFINLYKSERTRQMALSNENRLAIINKFFNDLSLGNDTAVKYLSKHKEECAALFSIIIKNKLSTLFPVVGSALKYGIVNNLIERSDL